MNFIDPTGGGVDDWIQYLIKQGDKVTKMVQWFDESFDEAKKIIESQGGTEIEDLGLTGLWTSTENGIQKWLLNSDGTRTLLDGLFTGTAPARALDIPSSWRVSSPDFHEFIIILEKNIKRF